MQVTGLLTLTDAKTQTYAVTGDLVGTWRFPPDQATDYYTSPTRIFQKGTESFDGCLAGKPKRCGTLNSDYILWSYLKKSGRLISGGCVHAPTGGTRAFRGVRGLITMTDTPVGDDVNTVYRGEVILDAEPDERAEPVPASGGRLTTASTGTAAGAC